MTEAGNTLTLDTTQGTVVIALRPDLAPAHVAHIKKLVEEKFYDGVVFHRVIEGFMAQTGCPHGTGHGRLEISQSQGRVQRRAACARHLLDGPRAGPEFRQFAILYLFWRRALSRQAIYRLGKGHVGHGKCRQDQARRTRPRSRQDHFRDGQLKPLSGTVPPECGASGFPARARAQPKIARSRNARRKAFLMRVDLFDFDLPPERIALRPAEPRDAARLLIVRPHRVRRVSRIARSSICRSQFRPGDVLVVNDTRVIPARLHGSRVRGHASARIEATLIEREDDACWRAFARPGKKLKTRRDHSLHRRGRHNDRGNISTPRWFQKAKRAKFC